MESQQSWAAQQFENDHVERVYYMTDIHRSKQPVATPSRHAAPTPLKGPARSLTELSLRALARTSFREVDAPHILRCLEGRQLPAAAYAPVRARLQQLMASLELRRRKKIEEKQEQRDAEEEARETVARKACMHVK